MTTTPITDYRKHFIAELSSSLDPDQKKKIKPADVFDLFYAPLESSNDDIIDLVTQKMLQLARNSNDIEKFKKDLESELKFRVNYHKLKADRSDCKDQDQDCSDIDQKMQAIKAKLFPYPELEEKRAISAMQFAYHYIIHQSETEPDLKKGYLQLKDSNKQLWRDIQEAFRQFARSKNEIESQNKRKAVELQQEESKIKKLSKEVADLSKQKKDLKKQKEQITDEIAQIKGSIEVSMEQLDAAKEQNKQVLNTLKSEQQGLAYQKKSIESEIRKAKANLETSKRQLEGIQSKVSFFQEKNENNSGGNQLAVSSTVRSGIKDNIGKNAKLKQMLTDLKEENRKLEEHITKETNLGNTLAEYRNHLREMNNDQQKLLEAEHALFLVRQEQWQSIKQAIVELNNLGLRSVGQVVAAPNQ